MMNACQRPVVAVKIPEVDEMLQRAQDKVDAIKRVQLRTAGSHPIDEVKKGKEGGVECEGVGGNLPYGK